MAKSDPYWLTAKFNHGQCIQCQHAHRKGERIFYYPTARAAYCASCGEEHYLQFVAAAEDERTYHYGR